MNEKIKELALEAGGSFYPDVNSKQLERFAELLIQECMNQVREQYIPVLEDKEMMKDTHWDGYVQCGVDSYVAIREYFYGEEE